MVLNLEENMNEILLKYERVDAEGINSVDAGDSKIDEGSTDIAELLPIDPFGMEFSIIFPSDPFSMDFNITLPNDPFGMDFSIEFTVSAMRDWIEEEFGFKTSLLEDDTDYENGDGEFFVELNFFCASADEEEEVVTVLNNVDSVSCLEDGGCELLFCGGTDELMTFGYEKYQHDIEKISSSPEEVSPPDALFFALGHLGVKDLLSVERVCKPLRDYVRDDPLLWRDISIDYSLCHLITDDDLVRLTNRAGGALHSLSLVKCLKITSSGLRRVLDSNPHLTKLSVAGCIKIKAGSVLEHIKEFNSSARPGIKQLQIGGLLGLTDQLFSDFNLLLGIDGKKNSSKVKYTPRYYSGGGMKLSFDNDNALDVETCSRCKRPGEIYDCPAENCQGKINSASPCRACILCIARCVYCGCCLEDREFEETFVLDLVCLGCFSEIINRRDMFLSSTSRLTLIPRVAGNC